MIKDPYEAELNVLYNSLQNAEVWHVNDYDFHVKPSADSNITANSQGLTGLSLPQNTKPLTDVQKFPSAVAAYVQINNATVSTEDLTAIITVGILQYVDVNGGVHHLAGFDSRVTSPRINPLVFPLPIIDSGEQQAGAVQLLVTASNAGVSHVVAYDVCLSVSILYLLREKNELLRALHKHHTMLSDLAEGIKHLVKYVVGI